MNAPIRPAKRDDASRLAEIEIFNYRLNFYPIFRNDSFYFQELQVLPMVEEYFAAPAAIAHTLVYDDGAVKGFLRLEGQEIRKLFVEPVLQGRGIGAALLEYAVEARNASCLWALEANERALRFYRRHGFLPTGERQPEQGTDQFLLLLKRELGS